jgi:tripartite-type tricarboxylate transporter receptor subunit TctC
VLALAGAALAPAWALAQETVRIERPVRLVVPYPPGGTTDLLARTVGARLAERINQPVVIENKAGAGGVLGSQQVAKAAPDGTTLLLATIASHGIIPALEKKPPYDPIRDFTPITVIAGTPNVLLVNNDLPAHTLAEFLALARSKPGALSFGSTSLGGSPHMSGELLKVMAKIDMLHVPYKGGGPMLIDLMGGQIPAAFDNLPSAMAHIRAGKVRALADGARDPDHGRSRRAGLRDVGVVRADGAGGHVGAAHAHVAARRRRDPQAAGGGEPLAGARGGAERHHARGVRTISRRRARSLDARRRERRRQARVKAGRFAPAGAGHHDKRTFRETSC